MSARTARRSAAALLAVALTGGLPAALPAAAAPAAGASEGYIVRALPGQLDAVSASAEALGATVTRTLGIIDAVAVEAPPAVAGRLRADTRVTEVTEDARVQLASTAYDPTADPASMYHITTMTGTRKVWGAGVTGSGVDVALIDSGVTAVPGLDGPGQVVHGPDLSFESQSDSTRSLDTFGHGTHMAGIIAGRDAGADPATSSKSAQDFLGMAPDARIVSVKVADAYGATDVSQVIAAIDWVVQHRADPGFNIRVLNLSFGTASTQSYLLDPLAHAAEQAWHAGIVVVVSAGNDGTGTGKLLNPAQNPWVVAVGAENNNGTMGLSDDTIPGFSTRGDGTRNPDLVAPGVSVQSLRVPGSWVDTQYPGAVVGERFTRGSGTSQAAAVVSGAVALLLQSRPSLTPDQVKAMLKDTALPLKAADVQAQGSGLVKADAALGTRPPRTTPVFPRATGDGSLDAARGGDRLVLDGIQLAGERDVFGMGFDSRRHAGLAADGSAWDGGRWNGSVWTGGAWAAGGWESATWSGLSWSGRSWAGRSWAGGYWNGRSWAGQSWTESFTLAAGSFNGRSWAGRSWAGGGWR